MSLARYVTFFICAVWYVYVVAHLLVYGYLSNKPVSLCFDLLIVNLHSCNPVYLFICIL